jgi:hypothetical protein
VRTARLPGRLVLVVALALLSIGAPAGDFQAVASTDKAWQPRGAHLTLGAALQIAEAEARKHHVSLANFKPPWFRYDYSVYHYDNGDGYYVWAFRYDGKVPELGNNFLVIVNDVTQHAQFVTGE